MSEAADDRRERQERKLKSVKVRVDLQRVLDVQDIFADLIFEADDESTHIRSEQIPESWVIEMSLLLTASMFRHTPSLDDIKNELRGMIDSGLDDKDRFRRQDQLDF